MPLGFQTLPQHHVMGGMNPPGAVVLGDAGNNGLSQMGGSLSDTSSSSSSNGEDDSSSSDSEKVCIEREIRETENRCILTLLNA